MAGSSITLADNNLNASLESPNETPHAGNAGGKSRWWSWTALANGTVNINTAGSNFNTLLDVYTGTALNALTVVASNDDAMPASVLTNINGEGLNASASVGFVIGDINNSRSVDSIDISSFKARSGQMTDASNFRFDLNAAGVINATDISVVKARNNSILP